MKRDVLSRFASHPAWVCGLKRQKGKQAELACGITPCVGVRIETMERTVPGVLRDASHPSRVCGLKRRSYHNWR